MHGKESPEVALSTNCCAKSNKHNMYEQCNSQTFVPVVLVSLMEHSFPSWNVLKVHHFPDRTMYSTPDGDHLREHSVNCMSVFSSGQLDRSNRCPRWASNACNCTASCFLMSLSALLTRELVTDLYSVSILKPSLKFVFSLSSVCNVIQFVKIRFCNFPISFFL